MALGASGAASRVTTRRDRARPRLGGEALPPLERDLAGLAYSDHDLVFCDELGRPYYPESISGWFIRRRKAAGIMVGRLHVLRHMHATIALTEGVPLHVVAGRLGDDPKTVLDTYAHLLPRSDEQAAAIVAAAVSADKPLTAEPAQVAAHLS